MRIAVLADIHSNLTALEAALADAEKNGGTDEVWCPGDIIGYGPDPHECIALLKKVCTVCVTGNHDLAAIGKIDTSDFNPTAAQANLWTRKQLTSEDTDYIKNLPLIVEREEFTIVHGSPREPEREYVFTAEQARENLNSFHTPYCIIGHTHIPLVFTFTWSGQGMVSGLTDGSTVVLGRERLIINPGGVGQPRDADPRASYGMVDTDHHVFTLHRVVYDIRSVQSRMREKGLPEMLWKRLGYGR